MADLQRQENLQMHPPCPPDMQGLAHAAVRAFVELYDMPDDIESLGFSAHKSDELSQLGTFAGLHGSLAFEDMIQIVSSSYESQTDFYEMISLRRQLGNLAADFRGTLPFNDAERRLALGCHRSTKNPTDLPAALSRIPERGIMANGLHTITRGTDMVRRWTAWRAQTDEFAGQGSVMLARRPLAGIIRIAGLHDDTSSFTGTEERQVHARIVTQRHRAWRTS